MSNELFDLVRNKGNLTKMFSLLKPMVNENISQRQLNELKEYFRFKDIGLSGGVAKESKPDSWYQGGYYTYQEWFTRKLIPEKVMEIKSRLSYHSIVIPNECVVESVGDVADTTSIIRLKKPAENVANNLFSLGVPRDYKFINMKLLTGHYHHVHSPITGIIKRALPIHANNPLFGRASLNFVEIANRYESVFLLIVGEAVVQDFNYFVKVGDKVEVFDDLGHFTWGSQVVMIYPPDQYPSRVPSKPAVKARQYCFAGDNALEGDSTLG